MGFVGTKFLFVWFDRVNVRRIISKSYGISGFLAWLYVVEPRNIIASFYFFLQSISEIV